MVKTDVANKKSADGRKARLPGAKSGPMPVAITPKLATLAKRPPEGPNWVHEAKFDGYRMLARIEAGSARLISRTGRNWTAQFPGIADALAQLRVTSAWIDGEVVVMTEEGRTSFQALQNAIEGEATGTLQYFAFDLLYVDGMDVRGVALADRKALLAKRLKRSPPTIRYSEHFATNGAAFFESVRNLGLEGMISKRADRPFQAGRGPDWVKVKCVRRQEFVIGGFTDPEGSRIGFGALLLGVYEPDGRLRYSGKVGTGFNDRLLASLHACLKAIEQATPPFYNAPRGAEGRRSHWVPPMLVAEVRFIEWTNEGTLREPSFVGLREDKVARDVTRDSA